MIRHDLYHISCICINIYYFCIFVLGKKVDMKKNQFQRSNATCVCHMFISETLVEVLIHGKLEKTSGLGVHVQDLQCLGDGQRSMKRWKGTEECSLKSWTRHRREELSKRGKRKIREGDPGECTILNERRIEIFFF